MAKTRPTRRGKRKQKSPKEKAKEPSAFSPELAQNLINEATTSLQTGQLPDALQKATKALHFLKHPSVDPLIQLPVLELIGEIHVELGDPDQAREYFTKAADLDPDASVSEEAGGGADKFLWLAQLCEQGGRESVAWFGKGAAVLRREIAGLEEEGGVDDATLDMNRQKLANALCGAAEVYMTDLSWEEDAEERCEALVTEACAAAPDDPEPLQTLASVRISQHRMEDARSALGRSMALWVEMPADDPRIPDFPTRISLARLLMEAKMEERSLDVIERLVADDDGSVEAWYLGGWCHYLLAGKGEVGDDEHNSHAEQDWEDAHVDSPGLLKSSRLWLQKSLQLYMMLEYEDERLKEHAVEIVADIDRRIEPFTEEEKKAAEGGEDYATWEDVEDDDQSMDES